MLKVLTFTHFFDIVDIDRKETMTIIIVLSLAGMIWASAGFIKENDK